VIAVGRLGRLGLEALEDEGRAKPAGAIEMDDRQEDGQDRVEDQDLGEEASGEKTPGPDETDAADDGQGEDADRRKIEQEQAGEKKKTPGFLSLFDFIEIARRVHLPVS